MCLREESEPHTYDSSGILAYFNPRFREGSDISAFPVRAAWLHFNPRFREGSDATMKMQSGQSYISIHASAKEATLTSDSGGSYAQDFNPRFREGSDGISDEDQKEIRISIHASAKEATLENSFCFAVVYISIHASAKEATAFWSFCIPSQLFQSTLPRRKRPGDLCGCLQEVDFNPRFREGSDDDNTSVAMVTEISIHASAKEATS